MNNARAFAMACAAGIAVSGAARADVTSDLKSQVDSLQRQLEVVKAQLEQVMQAQRQQQEQPKAPAAGGALTFSASPVTRSHFLHPAVAR